MQPTAPNIHIAPPGPPRRRRARRVLVRLLLACGLVYAAVVGVFVTLERTLVFNPSSPAKRWHDPVDSHTQDVWFTDASGTKLHGWWIPPTTPEAGAVLFAHGKGGNVSHRGRLAADLHRSLGAGVLLFEYPGFGKSGGEPSEDGCYAAGDAAYQWLTDEAKVPANRVILFGESLGGGVAVDLAARHDHRALALLYTFTTLPDVAKGRYPWLPIHTLMRTQFDNLSKIDRCTRPVFVAHGTADRVVPFWHGEQLYAAANGPKEFLRMEGAGHFFPSGDTFFKPLARFLAGHAP